MAILLSAIPAIMPLFTTGWPSTEGTIVESRVEWKKNREGDGPSYEAAVRYAYEVDGQEYTGNRIGYARILDSDPYEARRLVNRYPEGAQVQVYYKAQKPEKSLLETTGGRFSFLLVSAVGAAILFALLRFYGKKDFDSPQWAGERASGPAVD